ncbi:hypothetical protein D3C76_934220 [compost metagenome]
MSNPVQQSKLHSWTLPDLPDRLEGEGRAVSNMNSVKMGPYDLASLISQCDLNSPQSAELLIWERMGSVGLEF